VQLTDVPAWHVLRRSHYCPSTGLTLRCALAPRLGRYPKRGVFRDEWMGTQQELEELAEVEELAVLEWRDDLFRMLKRKPIGRR